MPFTSGQTRAYHTLAGRAFAALTPTERAGRKLDDWKRDTLQQATGKRSSKACDSRRDYEAAMAAIEIAGCLGIHWQTNLESSVGRRIHHIIRRDHPQATYDADYLLAIARSWKPNLPSLGQITTVDEDAIIRALLIALRR